MPILFAALLHGLCAVVFAAAVLTPAKAQDSRPFFAADLDLLVEGVGVVASPGVPGPIAVFGDQAFPVVAGREGEDKAAVVAAARYERGRVVLFGHGGYFDATTLAEGTTDRLMLNCARWVAGERKDPRVVCWRTPGVAVLLAEHGLSARTFDGERASSATESADVLVCDVARIRDDADIARLAEFVRDGGGVIAAGLGWGYLQTSPGKSLAKDHRGNRVFARMGLAFADRYADRVGPATAEAFRLLPLHAPSALARLAQLEASGTKPDPKVAAGLAAAVEIAAATAPFDDLLFRPRLQAALALASTAPPPSAAAPLKAERALARIAVRLERFAEDAIPPALRRAHPAAAAFPGDVPSDARTAAVEIVLSEGPEGWRSTGLYAAPGRPVTISVAEGVDVAGFSVRLGCHTDENWHHRSWTRHPDVAREFLLSGRSTVVASPFGGLVYLEPPRKRPSAGGTFIIDGAFAAPRFKLGETSPADWRDRIRTAPAPWAELATDSVVLTCESKHVRGIEDPTALLRFWDEALALYPVLSTRPAPKRPWRIVNDMQISAGYMHSGYPIMTHLDVGATMVDAAELRKGGKGWGFWHELGHNHQQSDWTFEGTGEVTCNLFSLYVLEKLCGQKPWDALRERGALVPAVKHLAAGGSFDAWKKDPFLALVMYAQVIDAFGYEALQKAFAAYRDAPASERPDGEGGKRDLWLKRLSAATGRNLGPFFDAWGVPVSDAAKAAVAGLPSWTPPPLRLLPSSR